ncbi:MAG: hypothetical protein L0Y56_00335 [Nitrospira sp.]|nr:hypothetical protein [Nitrospira sp.]
MIKRLRKGFIVIASIMLLLLGYSMQDSARGQETCDPETCICPGLPVVPDTIGWFDISVTYPFFPGTDLTCPGDLECFTKGLLGTIESLGAGQANIGGIDWLWTEESDEHTDKLGSQLLTWWSQKNFRNTYIQVTNTIGFCAFNHGIIFPGFACYTVADCVEEEIVPPGDPRFTCDGVNLEVKFLDEDCVEITNFCDPYTPGDTHVYNLGDLIDNNGIPRNDAVLQTHEGIFVVTPVNNCEEEAAISWNFLDGNMRLFDFGNDIDYGTNVSARQAEDGGIFDFECSVPGTQVTGDGFNDCEYDENNPEQLKHNFFELPTSPAAASDLVLISIIDDFDALSADFRCFGGLCPYGVVPGNPVYTPDDFCGGNENCDSCPPFTGCFVRKGLNDEFPISEDFSPPTPTPVPATPTPTPTVTVTPQPCSEDDPVCPPGQFCQIPPGGDTGVCVPATPSPTPGPGGGGNGCDIAGAPVQLGTAMANILIPSVPAFAIGYRIIRRRGRK